MDNHQQAAALGPTLIVEPAGTETPRGPRNMALVEGNTPQLSTETNDLLRRRLRSASLMLFAGFLAFFIRNFFYLSRLESTLDWTVLSTHGVVTLITGMVGLRFCTNCPHVLRHLRGVELIVFGGSAAFFLVLSYSRLLSRVADNYLWPVTPIWMLLIFTYALFIPNTVRRATVVIGSMAAAPVVLSIALLFISEEYATVIRTNEDFSGFITQTAMIMTLSAATAIFGASSLGTLRREAFEAKQLGQYRLKDKIGEGGMGEVYLAEHLLLKRPCAIKLIRPDKAGDSQALARFEREVKSTARLTHWNTVEIFDYGRADDGTFYYVMEYLPGLNLAQLVEMHGPLPPERVIHLLSQVCEALSEAHSHDFIHRDIKPANIFAAKRGDVYDVVKLLDFGLAKPISTLSNAALTQEGSITGSPLFMSPEQATGESKPDVRSDIYSLGAVGYYLLTGQPPFDNKNPIQAILAHAKDDPIPPTQRNAATPDDLEQIVLRCLEKDPALRFQNAESLRHALSECGDAINWTREAATRWWEDHGCPKKKALDAAVSNRND